MSCAAAPWTPSRVRSGVLGGYPVPLAEAELAALLRRKHRQLERFGLVDAAAPLLEATKRKVD